MECEIPSLAAARSGKEKPQCGAMEDRQMILRRCQPSESRELAAWIKDRHYLASTPPGYVVALEFLEGRQRFGAMLLGRPASRAYDADRVLELTRMFFTDEAPRNSESAALAMMRAWVRKWLPGIRLLLSYSDPAAGHTGGIYAADGWAPFGRTATAKSWGWKSRDGRRDSPQGPKQRWVRTP